jgi:2-phospho-L-lactate guanylyltransferase
MWAVVPCKRLQLAKRRLAPALTARECRRLVSAMLSDVLAALTGSAGVSGILVVSSDPAVAALARAFGARCLTDQSDEGLLPACAGASAHLSGEGADGVMVVPGDLPLLSPDDIARVVDAAGISPAVVLSPDRNDSGTNLVAMRPAGAMPYLFGENSFSLHVSAARKRGIEPAVIRSATLSLDIDTRDDLVAFARVPSRTRTCDYLDQTGLRKRLLQGGVYDPPLAGAARR